MKNESNNERQVSHQRTVFTRVRNIAKSYYQLRHVRSSCLRGTTRPQCYTFIRTLPVSFFSSDNGRVSTLPNLNRHQLCSYVYEITLRIHSPTYCTLKQGCSKFLVHRAPSTLSLILWKPSPKLSQLTDSKSTPRSIIYSSISYNYKEITYLNSKKIIRLM